MKKVGQIIKDILIYTIIASILIFIGYLTFRNATNDKILDLLIQFVGTLVTVLLGIIGIIEFCHGNGLNIFVPSTYINYKEEKQKELTKHYLKEFFLNEAEYFSQHSNSRIVFLLNQLGLSQNQFETMKMNILEIKLIPLHNLNDAKRKLTEIIRHSGIIIAQDGKDSSDLIYKEVKYFLNFTDIMFDADYSSQIIDCLVFLITEKKKEKNLQFNRVLVSTRGNFFLGLGVSQKLNVELIKITDKPIVFYSKSWIGNFSPNKKDISIFVHDVIVSGNQIKKSIELIKKHTEIEAIFCLINRLDAKEKQMLEDELQIPIYSLLELKDDDIEKL